MGAGQEEDAEDDKGHFVASGDFLDHVIKDMKTEKFLNEDFVVNILFGLLFANSDSISSVTTLAF